MRYRVDKFEYAAGQTTASHTKYMVYDTKKKYHIYEKGIHLDAVKICNALNTQNQMFDIVSEIYKKAKEDSD
ncbi:MAG: hypothetical protein GY861_04635 [bacterium]|nr:hypothetical protein [bacterium]